MHRQMIWFKNRRGYEPSITTICSGTTIVSFISENTNNFYAEILVIKLIIYLSFMEMNVVKVFMIFDSLHEKVESTECRREAILIWKQG